MPIPRDGPRASMPLTRAILGLFGAREGVAGRLRREDNQPHPTVHGGRMFVRPSLVASLTLLMPIAAAGQAVDDARIVQAAASEWLSYGRDYAETHYSPLDDINV